MHRFAWITSNTLIDASLRVRGNTLIDASLRVGNTLGDASLHVRGNTLIDVWLLRPPRSVTIIILRHGGSKM